MKESQELKATVEALERKLERKLDESMKKELELNRRLDEAKARELVFEKTKDLPIVESKEMRRRLKGMAVAEIQKGFDAILEEVKESISDQRNLHEEEKNLEEAISDIVNGSGTGTATDAGKAPDENGDEDGGTEVAPLPDGNEDPEPEDEESEPCDGDDCDESVPIAESQMQEWINALYQITPKN